MDEPSVNETDIMSHNITTDSVIVKEEKVAVQDDKSPVTINGHEIKNENMVSELETDANFDDNQTYSDQVNINCTEMDDDMIDASFDEDSTIIRDDYSLDEKSILLSADDLSQSTFLCRLCTQNILKEELIFIYDNSSDEGTTIADKINACLPITVSPTDKLPKQICPDCNYNLESSYIFSCSVTSAEETLTSLQQSSDCAKMNCPMCYEGSMKVMPSDVENNSFSDDSNLNVLANDDCLPAKTGIRQETSETMDSSSKNANSQPTRKRNSNHLQDDMVNNGPDPIEENEPATKRKYTLQPRGRPKGSKNRNTKFKNMNCFICHSVLKDYKEALSHALNAHCDPHSQTFPCPLCQDILTSEEELSNHIDVHNDIREVMVIQCTLCGLQCCRPEDLSGHVHDKHLSHPELDYSCLLCKGDEKFSDHHQLFTHLDQKHRDAPIPCSMCPRGFGGCDEYKKHFLETHVNSTNQKCCSECDINFPSLVEHANHIVETHCVKSAFRLPTAYNCFTCKNNYKSQYHLVKHACNVVFDELVCRKCSKAFPTRARLVFHLQFHQLTFTMRCDECLASFADEDTFYDHVRFQHEPTEQIKCEECNKMFRNIISLNMHMKRHQANRNHECTVCGKRFQNAQTLREHSVSHMTVKPFQCHICGAYLSRLSRLRLHLRSHSVKASKTSMKAYKCTLCTQLYPNMKNAMKHFETHTDVDSINLNEIEVSMVYRCEFCDGCFHLPADLNAHRRDRHPDHNASNAYTCSICGAQFSTYARVTTHKLSHGINTESLIVPDEVKEEKNDFVIPQYFLCHECDKKCLHYTYMTLHRRFQHGSGKTIYTCKVCKEKFATSWSLQCHSKRVHGLTGEAVSSDSGLYHCPECRKPYVSQMGLEHHLRRAHQTGDTPAENYICETCGKTFFLKSALEAHADAHKGLKRFDCKSCNRKFTHRAGLIRHMKLHSEDHPFVCEFCGKKFRDRTEKENHRRAHTGERPYMCDICGRTFHTRAVWLDHSRIHQDLRPYQCDICNQSFRRSYALKNHYLIHTGEKPFPCDICGKAFRFKQSLFAHKKKDHQNAEKSTDDLCEVLFIEEDSNYDFPKNVDLGDANAEEVTSNLEYFDNNSLKANLVKESTLTTNTPVSVSVSSPSSVTTLQNRTLLKNNVSDAKTVKPQQGYSLLLKTDQSAILNIMKGTQ